MPIRDNLVLYGAAILFVAIIIIVRYWIAPMIANHGGLAGTLATLAALYLLAVALDRQ